ncbi:hypothetical protein Tco_1359492 [Tanacetum coccineum]
MEVVARIRSEDKIIADVIGLSNQMSQATDTREVEEDRCDGEDLKDTDDNVWSHWGIHIIDDDWEEKEEIVGQLWLESPGGVETETTPERANLSTIYRVLLFSEERRSHENTAIE